MTIDISRRHVVQIGAAAGALAPVLGATRAGAHPSAASAATAAAALPLQDRQSAFVDMRFGMFLHFSLGSFTNEEWAAPRQSPSTFAPTDVNCEQWADAAVAAGMEYGVLTTKHHDGFSLWPTAYGEQNVMYSGYKQDIVRKYVDAFRSRGLRVGFYFSIWDRTEPIEAFGGYHVSDPAKSIEGADIDVIKGQLTELLTNYGDIDLLMTDGYTWQAGTQQVSVAEIREHVLALQPNCLLTDICAVTQPWLGDAIFWEEPLGITVPAGNTFAGVQGQTISNGWFWNTGTPTGSVMAASAIVDHLDYCQERYTSFLLNCPPNRDGRLDENIVNRLTEVGQQWERVARAPLPAQPPKVNYPVVPVAAFATAYRDPEPPYHAIDGQSDLNRETCWSTWTPGNPSVGPLALPQSLVIDLGGTWDGISMLEYLPKQWRRDEATAGDITSAEVQVSVDGVTWTSVGEVSWPAGPGIKTHTWNARPTAYVKLTAKAASGGYVNVNGVKVGSETVKPVRAARAVEDKIVRIDNVATGLSLSAPTEVDGVVRQRAWTGADVQKWQVKRIDDNYLRLVNVATAQSLSVRDPNREPGNAAVTSDAERVYHQAWALTPTGADTHLLTNRFNMLALSVPFGNAEEGLPVDFYLPIASADNELWAVTELSETVGPPVDPPVSPPATPGTPITPATPTDPAPPSNSSTPTTPTLPAADTVVLAAVGRAWIRKRLGRRTLLVRVNAAEPVKVRARLIRKSVTAAQGSMTVRSGAKTVEVLVPGRVVGGKAIVEVRIEDRAGNVSFVKRRVSVPPAGRR